MMSREVDAVLGARYRIVFDNAKPESVFVRIVKDGVTVNSWQENRVGRNEVRHCAESVASMLARAKETARTWIADDREMARLLIEYGDDEVDHPPRRRS
jgi:hypothetical protein